MLSSPIKCSYLHLLIHVKQRFWSRGHVNRIGCLNRRLCHCGLNDWHHGGGSYDHRLGHDHRGSCFRHHRGRRFGHDGGDSSGHFGHHRGDSGHFRHHGGDRGRHFRQHRGSFGHRNADSSLRHEPTAAARALIFNPKV